MANRKYANQSYLRVRSKVVYPDKASHPHSIAMIAQNIADGEYALDLLMIAKYFERIADHAVNIAQWVIFSVTGVHKEG